MSESVKVREWVCAEIGKSPPLGAEDITKLLETAKKLDECTPIAIDEAEWFTFRLGPLPDWVVEVVGGQGGAWDEFRKKKGKEDKKGKKKERDIPVKPEKVDFEGEPVEPPEGKKKPEKEPDAREPEPPPPEKEKPEEEPPEEPSEEPEEPESEPDEEPEPEPEKPKKKVVRPKKKVKEGLPGLGLPPWVVPAPQMATKGAGASKKKRWTKTHIGERSLPLMLKVDRMIDEVLDGKKPVDVVKDTV